MPGPDRVAVGGGIRTDDGIRRDCSRTSWFSDSWSDLLWAWEWLDGFTRFCRTRSHRDRDPGAKNCRLPAVPSAKVRHLEVGQIGHRARLPIKVYPYSAGVRGGLVGGAAMAVLAIIYGLMRHHSIWYPINLLAATGSARIADMSYANSSRSLARGWCSRPHHPRNRSLWSVCLYGIALPMFPRRPMLLGGILAPLFWSGILYAGLGIINPTLQARIDWGWFWPAQFAFGLVAGFVVARHERISTMQHLPFAVRAGIESARHS